jgi:hypothetical protein
MPFQFYCPQGHLLEGSESQAGQQSQCPLCGAQFIIPAVTAPVSAAPTPGPVPGEAPNVAAVEPQQEVPLQNVGQAIVDAELVSEATAAEPCDQAGPSVPDDASEPEEPSLYRIPCPSGHELQTPADMLGQQAMCPYCNQQFLLRREDSVEYKAHQAEMRRRREERLNEFWYKWSIRAAIMVGLLLLGMLIYFLLSRNL